MQRSRILELKKKLASGHDIVGREEYFSTAILVPLVFSQGEEHLLFEKRAPHIPQGNEICFPGGHFDKTLDSSYLGTALREAQEELGLHPDKVNVVGQLDTLVSPRGLIVECFLGAVATEELQHLRLDTEEVGEIFTVPVSWFRQNPPDIYRTRVEMQASYTDEEGNTRVLLPVDDIGLPPHYKQNRSEWLHPVVVYRWEPELIWGLTAAVVLNLMNKVFRH